MDENKKEKIREGLRRAKAQGKKLGNPNLIQLRNSDLRPANEARKRNAHKFASELIGILRQLSLEGFRDEKEIVTELNRREIKARRGGEWSTAQYRQLWKILCEMGYGGNRIEQEQKGEEKKYFSLLDLPDFQ